MKDFICLLLHKFGAGPSALRRREFVRHAAASQPCLALARASLWLLLTCVFGSEAKMLALFSRVCSLGKLCASIFLPKYITGVFRVAIVLLSCVFCG